MIELTREGLLIFLGGVSFTTVVGWLLVHGWVQRAAQKAQEILELKKKEAELTAKSICTQAEIEANELRRNVESELRVREKRLSESQSEIAAAESKIAQLQASLQNRLQAIEYRQKKISLKEKELEQTSSTYLEKLEAVTGHSIAELEVQILEETKVKAHKQALAIHRGIIGRAEEEAENKAKELLVNAMQRVTQNKMHDVTATIIQIAGDEIKGRLIGKEGRNIKSFEAETGTTLVVDESPDSVMISSFDPVRREIAKIALKELIEDGRIHPGTIEHNVAKAKNTVDANIDKLGYQAVNHLNLKNIPEEIITLLGKLHYRLSCNQNTLDHSIEVATLAGLCAEELGLDPTPAKRAGLFHDMGKAISAEYNGSHAKAGAQILESYQEDPRVINAVAAHHCEVEDTTIYAGIIRTADRLSATRPGTRTDSIKGYINRIQKLEKIAQDIRGVQEAYALQAGKEIRVIVEPSIITDDEAQSISEEIKMKIENTLQNPSDIRVTVIRERRYTATAIAPSIT